MDFNAITIAVAGTTVTSSASSAYIAIPNTADGNRAKFCRLQSTGFLYIKLGLGAITATTSDLLLSPNEGLVLATRQFQNIAYLQETAGAKLNIIPVEI